MNNQEIINNAPEGATHIDGEDDFCKDGYYLGHTSKRWIPSDCVVGSRSLADIKRIVELEKERDILDLEQKIKGAECVYEEMEIYSSAVDMRGAAQRVTSSLRNRLKSLKAGIKQ
jgi:hypothetical protein